MSIYFDPNERIFYLNSSGCTYAFGINGLGIPEHLHFGAPVGSDLSMGSHYDNNGRIHPAVQVDTAGNKYDLSSVPQELCTPYGGNYYEPSLILEYANGSRRSDLTYTGHEIFDEKPMPEEMPGIRKGQTLAVYLQAKGVQVTLFYTVSETTATIVRSMKVENLSDQPVRVARAYSYSFELPNRPWKAVYLTGASGRETNWTETELNNGIFCIGSRRGLPSCAFNPYMAITTPNTDEHQGDAYGMHLVYSGSWDLRAELTPFG